MQTSGLASMVNEASVSADVTAISSTNIKAQVIALRKELVDKGAEAGYVIVSTDVFEAYLTYTGTEYTPSRNEAVMGGRNVDFLGMVLIEANLLNQSTAKYYDYTGTLITIDLTEVDMIMGDAEAFSMLNNFEMFRAIDSENFSGMKAQVETNVAYRVTNADRIIIKRNTALSV